MRSITQFLGAFVLLAFISGVVKVPQAQAQEPSAQPTAKVEGAGWLWNEQFSGSSNSDGQVLAFSSTGGYNFNQHVGVYGGIPVYFIHTSDPSLPSTTSDGIGDVFVGVRLAFANPQIVNYRMTLTGTAPTGDPSKGTSTGHVTFDWTNHLDHRFGRWVPFANIGISNSTPDTLFDEREYISYGYLAHVQAGTSVHLIGPLSALVSGYDIEPWGDQVVYSRVIPNGVSGLLGMLTDGRVFDVNHQTNGGASLTRDYGASAGLVVNIRSIFDIWAGYNRSVPLALNTVSFGIGVNVAGLLRPLSPQ